MADSDLLGIGTIMNAGIGGIKSIFGGIQAIKGRKELKNLMGNYPTQTMSQGYQDAYKIYQGMANSNLPGYDIMKGQIDQSGARTMQNLERGAMSSNQLMSGVLSSQDKELDAIKNLGIMSAQWKAQQQQNLATQSNVMGEQQNQLFQHNVADKWGIQANMANGRINSGSNNLWNGMQDAGNSLMNYAGTKAYMDVLKGMQQQPPAQAQQFSQPIGGGTVDAQGNLNNTLSNMFSKWQANNGQ
jgi:hypothetical protein